MNFSELDFCENYDVSFKTSLVQKAYKYFLYGNYEKALEIYINLSRQIDRQMFVENIAVCNKKISQKRIFKNNKLIEGVGSLSIVYATDNNYAKYLLTSIISVLENNINIKLKIYILIDSEFLQFNVDNINFTIKKYHNCSVHFIDMGDKFRTIKMRIPHISFVTYYRILLASIVEEDRILYLDVDTICASSLQEFVSLDIENYYIAGVKAAGYHIDSEKICERLKIKSINKYINAGVLLMNLKLIREDRLEKTFIELLGNNYSSQDQDILNVACYNKIKCLDLKFNVMTPYYEKNNKQKLYIETGVFSKKQLEEAEYNPVIIHYATKIKPWNAKTPFDEYFWSYSYKSPYQLILLQERYDKNDYEIYKSLNPVFYEEKLKEFYKQKLGKELDLKNPKTYNEKIQWQKLYDNDKKRTIYSDKYLVRAFVKNTIGEKYLVSLLGVWNKFSEIDFDKLPQKFVLKANHGCGWNVVVIDKSKIDYLDLYEKFDKWMNINFAYRVGLEMQYKDINPKIIAEEYLENFEGDVYDYKVFCFNGKAKYIMFLSDRKKSLKMAFYDTKWNKLPLVYSYQQSERVVNKPKCLDELLFVAEKLAAGFPHVRVDFYIMNNGKIKFGEMTFTSASGFCKWNAEEYDLLLGSHFEIGEVRQDPSVSIVIAAYNVEKYIEKTLYNLSYQTFNDIEIIVIDDGSTDNTLNIIKKMSLIDKRIRYVKTENNGAGSARNKGLRLANGKYIIFLDADDFYEYNMIEEAYIKCMGDKLDFVVFRSNKYDIKDKKFIDCDWTIREKLLPRCRPFNQSDIRYDLFKCFNGWAWDKMYSMDFIKNNNMIFQEIRHNNDMLFVYSALLKAKRIDIIDTILAHHRVNICSSLSNTREMCCESAILALGALQKIILEGNVIKDRIHDFYGLSVQLINFNIRTLPSTMKEKFKRQLQDNIFLLPKSNNVSSCVDMESYKNILNFLQ